MEAPPPPPRTNLTVWEMSPFCELYMRTDIFLFHLENLGIGENRAAGRFREMLEMLRLIILVGDEPYSEEGQDDVDNLIDLFMDFMERLYARYFHLN
ncbi:hypothetical protein CAEBREN_18401 [Caenorhabditis brenneri]|uniref:Uncharacterized protein n=1 Tax=Caenorhabditis brenneri TaxID=135651 RepID=G0MY87_CAEBE|nr:hypothetical protein CAEBREN_18401 [Caenorhabditis brenneri]